ncbi:dabb-domain-containing protein [Sordaria sp. MPI-SDFR-AT-0083]|nr:dabb-domain-containing protein [Sordaria sp. MPI-SDFR-AT-0083]
MGIVHVELFEFKPLATQEEVQDGRISHVFVSEFDTPEDRKFYLEEDPAFREFVESIEGIVEGRQVVEFSPGEF